MVYTVGAHTSIQVDVDRTPLRSLIWYAEKVAADLEARRKAEEIAQQQQRR